MAEKSRNLKNRHLFIFADLNKLYLFNTYLDDAITKKPKLNYAKEDGRLLAFADDIMVIAEDKEETAKIIQGFEDLATQNLMLNKVMTKIMSDRKELEGLEEIEGVPMTKSFK